MRHAMMMTMHGGHMSTGLMMAGMVHRTIMKAILLGLVVVVAVLWFKLRQQRTRDRDWM